MCFPSGAILILDRLQRLRVVTHPNNRARPIRDAPEGEYILRRRGIARNFRQQLRARRRDHRFHQAGGCRRGLLPSPRGVVGRVEPARVH
jgi:hypothetical protein